MYMLVTFILLMNQYSETKTPLRIYGGKDANPDEYPYIVRLEVQNLYLFANNIIVAEHTHLCTASALSPTWMVTAAHCFRDLSFDFVESPYNISKLVIRYGSVSSSPWKNYTLSDVVSTIEHPLYYDNHDSFMSNDIGLVKTKPILLRTYMRLSAVDFMSMYGQEGVLAGFGITTKRTSEGKLVTGDTLELQKPLQIINILITKCPRDGYVMPSFCLAKKCGDNIIACGGDSGGPLVHPTGIVGVLSSGEASGHCLDDALKKPTIYVGHIIPISPYLEWICSYLKA